MEPEHPAPARRAIPQDAEELVRLRAVMIDSLAYRPAADADASWRPAALATLRAELADPAGNLTAFVVDAPDGAGLAACAVGTIEHRLGGPGNPDGSGGHVFSVATDPGRRRRGHARACTEALLGFARTPDPAMRLYL
ncbi:GNAT family N-acetyltransferase [Streptomyces sp. NPDC049916]|uniref:GNAT family N-acetyltransferase n=1 Tax=Streptomyces sp. NPDC049916 TaxID=3155156 RepID=UPI00342063A6